MVMKMSCSFFSSRLLVALPLLLAFSATLAFGATQLPEDEVEALKDIAKTLGKTNWNFSADPCGKAYGWAVGSEDAVTCNCTLVPNSTVCHVTSIVLKSQNLPGELPPELIRLPYLQEIDLTRNYLNGTIPPEWGILPLVHISLVGNRLTGSLPVELANITTLKNLTIDFNSFSGILPAKLGNLSNIERMLLTSNNFTGELPETFAQLTTLIDFRISDNSFTGKIPNFIQNWTKLEKLAIQASGLTGPIPLGISLLTKLTDLRITDLNGPEQSFPQLKNLTELKTLMLRNCNISGELPEYLGEMTTLKNLDLSFNKLTGDIPSSFSSLNPDYIFLTGNMLTGSITDLLKGDNIDLSYNDFMTTDSSSCRPRGGLNLFASSSGGNTSSVSCLTTAKCPKTWYSLHINCGGQEVALSENFTRPTVATYEDDTYASGPSTFYQSNTNWASSNTGYFPDDDSSTDSFVATANSSRLFITNPQLSQLTQLYMNARLSPISLTYYGFCLGNGNYTVNLHFAEIMFQNDTTYSSLGRRIFDIYIQGTLVKKDFNIASEAGGFGIPIVRNFTAHVTSSTLEIRLYWAGKGTTGIPTRGTYGPLISAISVDPNFEPPKVASNGSRIPVGVVVGIGAGGSVVIVLLALVLCSVSYLIRRRKFADENQRKIQDMLNMMNSNRPTYADGLQNNGKRGHDLSVFSYASIAAATRNFSDKNKLGEGGFGPVYMGKFVTGQEVAVKRLSKRSRQGISEFKNELILIYELQHTNLVQLFGFCIHGEERMLLYEYMSNNSLDYFLFDSTRSQHLDWDRRFRIIEGIAQGLLYLHKYSRRRIIHRDLKASNVLLDERMNPKISDFGMSTIFANDEEEVNTMKIVGTRGYMSPESIMGGNFSTRSDVYSFGVLMLEILSGRKNNSFFNDDRAINLVGYAWALWKEGAGLALMDPTLGASCDKDIFLRCIHVALLCVEENAADRPTMTDVIFMLTNESMLLSVRAVPIKPAFCIERNVITADVGGSGPEMVASVNGVSNSDFVGR